MPRRRIFEAKTRKELIDPQLEKAGWDVVTRVARYPLARAGERLRAQMSEAERQTEMLFQSLLAQSFSLRLSQSFGG